MSTSSRAGMSRRGKKQKPVRARAAKSARSRSKKSSTRTKRAANKGKKMSVLIRTTTKPTDPQVEAAIAIFRKNGKALGFLPRAALDKARRRGDFMIAVDAKNVVVGFAHFHVCRDQGLTIYEIATDEARRGMGIGRALVEALKAIGTHRGATHIRLKCPEEQPANKFYAAIGFTFLWKQPGKNRDLNCWRKQLGGGFQVKERGNAHG